MTFQIGKARGTNPAVETKKPEEAPPSNVSPGILSPSPNTRWIPDAAPTSTWQKGVVSAEAKQQRAEAELNGTAITIGASEARIEAGNAIKQMQTVASSAGTIVQETTTSSVRPRRGTKRPSKPKPTMMIMLPSCAAKRFRRSPTRGSTAICRWVLRLPENAS